MDDCGFGKPRHRRAVQPVNDRTLLAKVGAQIDVLLLVRGQPATMRWRGQVVRSDHGLVTLAPWGCASEIVFELEQAVEVFAAAPLNTNARKSVEQTQAARLARMRAR